MIICWTTWIAPTKSRSQAALADQRRSSSRYLWSLFQESFKNKIIAPETRSRQSLKATTRKKMTRERWMGMPLTGFKRQKSSVVLVLSLSMLVRPSLYQRLKATQTQVNNRDNLQVKEQFRYHRSLFGLKKRRCESEKRCGGLRRVCVKIII